ncbi:MAG: DNA/RNA non-specific endonuclease [Sphingomonas sp.]|uniref:DNA/RNA non-specific endonuclease n=1 Tax=Sphingomonas sp. TaxID=28214 RepID=UPI0035A8BD70|nr:DNA/RNA non-specific endonuclease [Sphingomonas sp.]
MDQPSKQRQRAFSVWLRTGRLSVPDSNGVERKFNPWHDLEDGRFTFVGGGRYFGRAGAGQGDRPARRVPKIKYVEDRRLTPISTREEVEAWRAEQLAKNGRKPGYREAIEAQYLRYLDVISRRSGSFGGGGGGFGGGGATGTWDEPASVLADAASTPLAKPSPPQLPAGDPASAGASRSGAAAIEPRHQIVRNGYTYEIDSRERTRRVSGMLSSTATSVRSRTSQTQAGGADRRVSDDGGHYIAARFRGPTEAFNHFAQDANFNRGGYRVLEDEWARDKRAGRSVTVTIVPRFDSESARPSTINVWWTVDGKGKSVRFPNERSEKRRGGN